MLCSSQCAQEHISWPSHQCQVCQIIHPIIFILVCTLALLHFTLFPLVLPRERTVGVAILFFLVVGAGVLSLLERKAHKSSQAQGTFRPQLIPSRLNRC